METVKVKTERTALGRLQVRERTGEHFGGENDGIATEQAVSRVKTAEVVVR